jgi:GNAT superfamily N-acetyltransferase
MLGQHELPIASSDLSRRLEAAATRYLVERYSGPGNPMGMELLRLDSVVATKVPFMPQNALMNAVHGLEDAALLPQLLGFYAQPEQPCWVELAPHVDPALSHALIEHGFRPHSYKAVLYGAASTAVATASSEVRVTRVDASELELFLDTLNKGFDMPDAMLLRLRRNQAFWCDIEHWRLYLAWVGDQPAGAAVLALTDGLGYLAAGSALPAYRGRGVHAALIARRIADAAQAGCELVTGQAAFTSSSHRNQERAGLKLAHVRQDWTNAR